MSVSVFAIIAGVVLLSGSSGPSSGLATAPPGLEEIKNTCKAAVSDNWEPITKARKAADYADALRRIQQLETACAGWSEAMALVGSLHAELELDAGRPAEAVHRLSTLDISRDDPLWPTSRWVYLAALEGTGDAAGFRQVRDELLAVHDAAMIARPGVRKVERFETPLAVIDAYEGDIAQGPFIRHTVFVAAPKDGGMFVTLSVSTDSATDAMIGQIEGAKSAGADFLDVYPCDSHVNAGLIARRAGGKPAAYDKAKAEALSVFANSEIFQPFAKVEKPQFCAFEAYMLPGFTPSKD